MSVFCVDVKVKILTNGDSVNPVKKRIFEAKKKDADEKDETIRS